MLLARGAPMSMPLLRLRSIGAILIAVTGCDPKAAPGGNAVDAAKPVDSAAPAADLVSPAGAPDLAAAAPDLATRPDLAAAGRWYWSCGDPVCRGHTLMGVPACTTQM